MYIFRDPVNIHLRCTPKLTWNFHYNLNNCQKITHELRTKTIFIFKSLSLFHFEDSNIHLLRGGWLAARLQYTIAYKAYRVFWEKKNSQGKLYIHNQLVIAAGVCKSSIDAIALIYKRSDDMNTNKLSRIQEKYT